MSARDLDALGIDRATTRWRACRAYLQQVRAESAMRIDRVLVGIVVEGKALENAQRAGNGTWVSGADYADAVDWMGDRLAR